MKNETRKSKKFSVGILQVMKLPQCVTVLVLFSIAVVVIVVSRTMYITRPFFSSVLSNVFAGLVTGIAICLISGIKNVFHYNTERRIVFLNQVHEKCLAFFNMHHELIAKANRQKVKNENLYNDIYDLLCAGNDIDALIAQSQFDRTQAFNPYEFFKKDMNYDAVEQMKKNESLREEILMVDETALSGKEIIELFADMDKSIFKLNSRVLAKIKEYEIQRTLSQKTFF